MDRSRGWGTYVMCLTTRQRSAQVVKLLPGEARKNEKSTFQRKYDKQCILKNAVEENVNIVDITISHPRDYIPQKHYRRLLKSILRCPINTSCVKLLNELTPLVQNF